MTRMANHWPAGPWDSEPDRESWDDETTGLPCLVIRHPRLGHLCGYVGIRDEHSAHGMLESSLYDLDSWDDHDVEGLTWASKRPGGLVDDDRGTWWFGFDYAHFYDVTPGMVQYGHERGTYKTFDVAKTACGKLAAALAAMQVPA